MNDPWQILGVERNASPEEIKRAYRKLAREHHPDLGGDPDRFREIQQAYDHVTNPPPEQPHHAHENFDPFHEIFQRHFGVNFGWRAPNPRNANIETQVHITVAETITGAQRSVHLNENGAGRSIQIEIPKGMNSGDTVKYAGMGSTINPSLPAGDLFVRVQVTPPPGYTLDQGTLYTQQSVPLWQILLGTTVKVQDPLGGDLIVKVPPGTGTGTRLRLPQKGGWVRHTQQRGDLLVEIVVIMPELTEKQREIISEWL